MKKTCDLVIVGGGPSGLSAAIASAKAGLDVLLLERNEKIGVPLTCAEGITHLGLTTVVELDRKFVATDVHGIRLFSPGGRKALIDHPNAGYVLHRDIFEPHLAELAQNAGAEICTGCRAENLRRNGSGFDGITAISSEGVEEISFKVIVAADGVESVIAREGGLTESLLPSQVESCAQYRMSGIDADPHVPEVWFSREFAPGGYAWVFPKGPGSANVGLGVVPTMSNKRYAFELLDDFVQKRFPNGTIEFKSMGLVPCFEGRKRMLKGNLMAVGDAARLIDSLTGAGISTGLHSGRMAGLAAAKAVKSGRLSDLREYPNEFMAAFGRKLRFYRLGREIFSRMSEDEFDFVVELVDEIFGGQTLTALNPVDILRKVITRRPSLMRHAPRLIWR